MTWWFSDTHFKNNVVKEVLGGKDFRLNTSLKLLMWRCFKSFFVYYLMKPLSVNK